MSDRLSFREMAKASYSFPSLGAMEIHEPLAQAAIDIDRRKLGIRLLRSLLVVGRDVVQENAEDENAAAEDLDGQVPPEGENAAADLHAVPVLGGQGENQIRNNLVQSIKEAVERLEKKTKKMYNWCIVLSAINFLAAVIAAESAYSWINAQLSE